MGIPEPSLRRRIFLRLFQWQIQHRHSETNDESGSVERKEKRTGWKFLADSPWLWGALAVVAGAAGSVSPTATLGWIFFAA